MAVEDTGVIEQTFMAKTKPGHGETIRTYSMLIDPQK